MDSTAITGLSFKFPQGAEDEHSFWDMLETGRNARTLWPSSRLNVDSFHQGERHTPKGISSKYGNFLQQDPAVFDAPFFSITSQDAASMDPQQRLVLECVYHALENAGVPAEKVAGTDTAVFAATMTDDYLRMTSRDPENVPTNIILGTNASILANKVSWQFNLKGPSVQLNTACSSSLVAMDLACQALRSGQCSMAIVAASNLLLSPDLSLHMSRLNMGSTDGFCYSFDYRANGYARGEGIAVIVIKKLEDAVRDHDVIRGIIRATGSNQDGHTPGITQPNRVSQEALIRSLYQRCDLGLEKTRYVEAHGTGTKLGDSTEIEALQRVFKASRSAQEPLHVGSVKANMGHLEGCSGLASIIKSVLILEKGVIPPNPNFEKWNPKVNQRLGHVKVPTACTPWPSAGLRRISINSFGFGGSNGHMILDDAYHTLESLATQINGWSLPCSSPGFSNGMLSESSHANGTHLSNGTSAATNGENSQVNGLLESSVTSEHRKMTNGSINGTTHGATNDTSDAAVPKASHYLMVWSAQEEPALKRVLQQYNDYYTREVISGHTSPASLAHTLAIRRSIMPWRSSAVVGSDASSVTFPDSSCKLVRSNQEGRVALIFTGQGAQYAGMGSGLLQYPVYRDTLNRIDHVFKHLGADWTLPEKMRDEQNIDKAEYSQPICTALQLALVELLRSFNVVAEAVIGHSSGEIAAAYTAGLLSFESACKVAYHRGRLAGRLAATTATPGAMMSVNFSEVDANTYLRKAGMEGGVHVACVNSPGNVTLSGHETAIDALGEDLGRQDIFARKLNTGLAYHSPAMQEMSSEYLDCLGTLERGSRRGGSNSPVMVSSVTGQTVPASTVSSAEYWVENLVSPVRFTDALQHLVRSAGKADGIKAVSHLVEVGPAGALRRPVADTVRPIFGSDAPQYMPTLSRTEHAAKSVLELVGQLFISGHPVSIPTANQWDESSDVRFLADTPSYPFDRTRKYWHESRLSRDWRLREPAGILGVRAYDWNPLEPRWRRMLSMKDTPWIAEHSIQGNALFPATGTILMALEAATQAASSDRPISGYYVKEATLRNPILIQPKGTTEVVTHAFPLRRDYEKTSQRFKVEIFSCLDEIWSLCLDAVVHLELDQEPNEVDGGRNSSFTSTKKLVSPADIDPASFANRMATPDFYKWLRDHGLEYGETFALIDGVSWNAELAIGRLNHGRAFDPTEGFVHPAVLDACYHLCFVGPSNGMSKSLPTMVPHKIRHAWVSARGWPNTPDDEQIRVAARSRARTALPGMVSSFTAFSGNGSMLCHFGFAEMLPLSRDHTEEAGVRKLLNRIDWKPQLSLMDNNQLWEYCHRSLPTTHDNVAVGGYRKRLETTLRAALRRMWPDLQATTGSPPHMKKYLAWIERQLQASNDIDLSSGPEDPEAELERLAEEKPSWRVYSELARNIVSIARGEMAAAELLNPPSLARGSYNDLTGLTTHNGALQSAFELFAHRNPSQKILEVGASTGGLTTHILSILQGIEARNGGAAYSEYVYMDKDPSFFDAAAEQFANHRSRMTFTALNADMDVQSQSSLPASYDLVVSGNALHATKNLSATLGELHSLLKPGGRLVIQEPTATDQFCIGFAFGTLPSWWLAEGNFRVSRPTITEGQWDDVLKANSFTGNDLIIREYESDMAHLSSIIISTAIEKPSLSQPTATQEQTRSSSVVIVTNGRDNVQESLGLQLENDVFRPSGYDCNVVTLADAPKAGAAASDHVVFLADLGGALLAQASQSEFRQMRSWIQRSKNLLWVSGATGSLTDKSIADSPSPPQFGMKDGFLRTLRSEYPGKRLVALTLDHGSDTASRSAEAISKVFGEAFETPALELEYISRDDVIYSGRFVEEAALNWDVSSSLVPQKNTEPWMPGPPLKLTIGSRGAFETLQFTKDSRDNSTRLGPQEVEVEAVVWGLDYRDALRAAGRFDGPEGFGTNCAGIVARIGPECTQIKPGDRVHVAAAECISTYVRVFEGSVLRISNETSFESACAVLNPATMAWHSLSSIAQLQKGESVLIHSAAEAIGQLAIQVATIIGADVFATVATKKEKELLVAEYKVSDDRILFNGDVGFAQAIRSSTDGYGVDVVLNSLAGEGLCSSWELVAPYGRFVEIGHTDINANSSLPMGPFARNATFSAIDVTWDGRNQKIREAMQTSMQLFEGGKIRSPASLQIFNVAEVEEAFQHVHRGESSRRAILKVDPSTPVEKSLVHRKTWLFDSGSTYVVAGGLGGIGQAILDWMAVRGAKYLLVPSRSGASSIAAVDTIERLAQQGITVETPKCDVSSAESVAHMLADCATTMPPIRGCLVATMALNDSVFETMSYPQWGRTVRSKVDASWNLHSYLPKDLDFFVLLSSISGILGNAGQSNYAAGCSFQDALARHRVLQGQRAISIDVGVMGDVGVVAENEALSKRLESSTSMSVVTKDEFLALLDVYCDPAAGPLSPDQSHVTMGITAPADILARGVELPDAMESPVYGYLMSQAQQGGCDTAQAVGDDDPTILFRQAASTEKRTVVVVQALATKLAKALSADPEMIESNKALHAFGVDSLVAVELRNWIAKKFSADIAVFELTGGKSLGAISELVATSSQFTTEGGKG